MVDVAAETENSGVEAAALSMRLQEMGPSRDGSYHWYDIACLLQAISRPTDHAEGLRRVTLDIYSHDLAVAR